MNARIVPATMGSCALAAKLFGVDHVQSGDFLSPVRVVDVSSEDLDAAESLFTELGFRIVREP